MFGKCRAACYRFRGWQATMMLFCAQKWDPQCCHCDREPPMFEIANGHYFGFDGTHFEVQSSQSVEIVTSPGRYHFWTNPLHQQFVSAELLHSRDSAHCASCGTRCSKCTNGYNINTWAKLSKPTISLLGGAYQLYSS